MVQVVLMFLIAFGIVGSVEARMRLLLVRLERRLDAVRDDLARVDEKVGCLLRQERPGVRESGGPDA